MQIIYLLPFLFASIASGVVCLLIPRFRRHVLAATIAPIAFAICSIVGVLFAILAAEYVGFDDVLGFNRPADSGSLTVAALTYGLSGLIGAMLAVTIAKRAQRWIGKMR